MWFIKLKILSHITSMFKAQLLDLHNLQSTKLSIFQCGL